MGTPINFASSHPPCPAARASVPLQLARAGNACRGQDPGIHSAAIKMLYILRRLS